MTTLQLDPGTGALGFAGPAVSGVFLGGNSGGVGDPLGFGASGTSPLWLDGCTVLVDDVFVFDGCPFLGRASGGEGGGGGGQHPPASSFVLTVHPDPTWGGHITSNPPGIDVDACGGPADSFMARFPVGTFVGLQVALCPVPAQTYDVTWTGACMSTGTTSGVTVSSDVTCQLKLVTPASH